MSAPLICTGCGQPIAVPAGYRRNKIQCGCGVIVEVPDSARREAGELPAPAWESRPKREAEAAAETWAADVLGAADGITTSPRSAPVEEPEPAPALPVRDRAPVERPSDRVPCRRCGQLIRRQRECPTCDAEEEVIPNFSLGGPEEDDDEWDGKAYVLDGGNDVLCSSCRNPLPPGSSFCTRCGLDLVRRKKKKRTYQPLQRRWETTMRAQQRIFLWGVFQAGNFLLGLAIHSLAGGSLAPYLVASIGFAAMTAFLMGTYDELEMERDIRGRVVLKKTWRVCFFVASIRMTEVRGFSGVLASCCNEVSAWEWIVFGCLFLWGILPGVVWWFCVIYKTTYQAALTRDHGHVDVVLFQGWSRSQMEDIARSVGDAAGLRCEGV
jgi:hypothetical protein